jgi:hypothetical protein
MTSIKQLLLENFKYYNYIDSLILAVNNRSTISRLKSSYASNADLESYIIYRNSRSVGLFSNILVFFSHVEYAISKGMIPYIDLQHFPSQLFMNPRKSGYRQNAWDCFFEQPCLDTAEQAYSAVKVHSSNGSSNSITEPLSLDMRWAINGVFVKSKKIIYQNYFRLNEKMRNNLTEAFVELFPTDSRVIGVNIRGLCYRTENSVKGHPIHPRLEYFINRCKDYIRHKGYTHVYLSCIDNEIVKVFQDEFEHKLIWLHRNTYKLENRASLFRQINESESVLTSLSQYLTSIYLHQHCDYVLGSICSSSAILPLIVPNSTSYSFPYLGKH